MTTKISLNKLFKPRSIAVIGASNAPRKVGNNIMRNLLDFGYRGKLYPINLKDDYIVGLKAFRSVLDVPNSIDLAVIAIPAHYVPQAIEECGKKEIPFAVIISAGFSEIGKEGKQLQDELLRIAKLYNVRLLGPNCLGVINPIDNVNASFSSVMPAKGNVAFASQSGAICTAIISLSINANFGFSRFISIGNKVDIDETDMIQYFAEDKATDVILLYLESIKNGRRFLEVARRVAKQKPIILVKGGLTDEGVKAVSSHTGAMAGSREVLDAALKQAGVIKVNCISELFEAAEVFSKYRILKDNAGLAVVTNGGGVGVISADMCAQLGIQLTRFDEETKHRLAEVLPEHANIVNPLDIIGDANAERYRNAIRAVLDDENTGLLLVELTPQSMTEILETAEAVIELARKTDKPIITNFLGREKKVKIAQELLSEANLPHLEFTEQAMNAIYMLFRFNNERKRQIKLLKHINYNKGVAEQVLGKVRKEARKHLSLEEGFELLSAFGIPLPRQVFSNELKLHIELLKKVGAVVMKLDACEITHKSELKLVSKKITNEKDLEHEFKRIKRVAAQHSVHSFKICSQIFTAGNEFIIGGIRDPVFNSVVTFGLGGIFTEVFRDISMRVLPLTESELSTMLTDIKGYRIIKGYRGRMPSDEEAIKRMIMVIATLLEDFEEIKEIEVNPFIGGPHSKTSFPVDVLVKLG